MIARPVQVHHFQLFHSRQHVHAGVGGPRAQKVQLPHCRHLAQELDPFFGYPRSGEVQLFESGQSGQMLQSFIGDHGVAQVQAPQVPAVRASPSRPLSLNVL